MTTPKAQAPRDIDADDEGLAPEAVGQPAGDQRGGHAERDQDRVHQGHRRGRQRQDLGEVERDEDVDHAQPAAAAAEHRRQVQPAQVAIEPDRPEGVPHPARGHGRRAVAARLADEGHDAQRDEHGRDAEEDERPAPAPAGDQPGAEQRHDDRPDVAASDVGADGEAPTLRRELLGQQAVADRVLGRSADACHDQATTEGHDARRQGHEGLEAAHHDATPAEEPGAGEVARQRGIGRLREAGGQAADGDQQPDGADRDAPLVDDRDVDERHQHGLGVVRGMERADQPERAHRPDDRQRGRLECGLGVHAGSLSARLGVRRATRRADHASSRAHRSLAAASDTMGADDADAEVTGA